VAGETHDELAPPALHDERRRRPVERRGHAHGPRQGQPALDRRRQPTRGAGKVVEEGLDPPSGARRVGERQVAPVEDHAARRELATPRFEPSGQATHGAQVTMRLRQVRAQQIQHGPIALGEVPSIPGHHDGHHL
jgi:hypothetical protein